MRESERPESRPTRKVLRIIQASPLPNPVSLHEIRLPSGRVLRPDLAYPDLAIAIEADSYKHHGAELGWRNDIDRNNVLQGVLRFTWADATNRPEYVVTKVRDALRQRGLQIPSF